MAPVYLNPPLDSDPFLQIVQQKDDQLLQKLLRSSSNPASDSLSCPTFLHSIQEQRMINLFGESQQHGQKVDQCMANGGSSDLQISIQASNSKMNNISNDKLPIRKREIGEGSSKSDDVSSSSAKWMSSKMRLMHKMINSFNNSTTTATDESVKVSQKLQNQMHDNGEVDSFSNSSSSNTIRVCSDCNTTTTPLWRSGPRGPKSLCNACGIRKRKARRAMEAEAAAAAAAAGNGTVAGTSDSTFTKIKLQIKDKKPRISHVGQYKKHCKSPESDHPHRCDQIQRKICFKDFALSLSNSSALKQVLPKDVEEAAILLMELSCGFNHT